MRHFLTISHAFISAHPHTRRVMAFLYIYILISWPCLVDADLCFDSDGMPEKSCLQGYFATRVDAFIAAVDNGVQLYYGYAPQVGRCGHDCGRACDRACDRLSCDHRSPLLRPYCYCSPQLPPPSLSLCLSLPVSLSLCLPPLPHSPPRTARHRRIRSRTGTRPSSKTTP